MTRTVTIAAFVLALSPLALAQQFVMMPDSSNNRLVAFNAVNGTVLNSNVFPLQGGQPISAVQVGNEIWVTEQLGDRISRWTPTGTLIGNIGGQFPGGGLDNLRGSAFIDGTFYVCNAGTNNGAPGNAIVKYDSSGNLLGSFPTTGFADSPFGVLHFQGDLLVSGSANNKDIYRFTLSGTPLSVFHDSATLNFTQQLGLSGCCEVYGCSNATGRIVRMDSGGNVLSSFTPTQPRGVFVLEDGNVLNTDVSGAWVYDVVLTSQAFVYQSGGARHLSLFRTPTAPPSYCTAGTSTNGCVATISADNNPSVSLASSCRISVANVEGQKSGLIFYSVTGSSAVPWNATSFLCVKSPIQRTQIQSSGGTATACDGRLTLDWNQFQSSHPAAIGKPWSAGHLVHVQAWFRDPPAGTSTNLSDAIELTYFP
ncbi:MAG: hypothetical protein NTV21_17455 [Planctomycetota bacterium]|nr:hypothetical protein [Planctomycetota bacterium]